MTFARTAVDILSINPLWALLSYPTDTPTQCLKDFKTFCLHYSLSKSHTDSKVTTVINAVTTTIYVLQLGFSVREQFLTGLHSNSCATPQDFSFRTSSVQVRQ